MGQKFRVLIGDNSHFREKAWGSWLDLSQFEIREMDPDAIRIFDTICTDRPHIIVLSENMDYISGIGMVKAVSAIPGYRPQFIITDESPSTAKYRTATELGAAFYISRPYSYTVLNDYLLDLAAALQRAPQPSFHTPDQVLADALHELQIPTSIKGYRYVKYAVHLAIRNGVAADSITKGLYPNIAEVFHTTPISVERAIRHAITLSWKSCQETESGLFHRCFGHERKRPSNSRYILTVAEYLEADWHAAQAGQPEPPDGGPL